MRRKVLFAFERNFERKKGLSYVSLSIGDYFANQRRGWVKYALLLAHMKQKTFDLQTSIMREEYLFILGRRNANQYASALERLNYFSKIRAEQNNAEIGHIFLHGSSKCMLSIFCQHIGLV